MNSDRPAHSLDRDDLELHQEVALGALPAVRSSMLHLCDSDWFVDWIDEDALPGRSREELEVQVATVAIVPWQHPRYQRAECVPFALSPAIPYFCDGCLGVIDKPCAPWCASNVPDDRDERAARAALSECSPERLGRSIPLERAPARSRAAGGIRPEGETSSDGALDFVAQHLGVESWPPR